MNRFIIVQSMNGTNKLAIDLEQMTGFSIEWESVTPASQTFIGKFAFMLYIYRKQQDSVHLQLCSPKLDAPTMEWTTDQEYTDKVFNEIWNAWTTYHALKGGPAPVQQERPLDV